MRFFPLLAEPMSLRQRKRQGSPYYHWTQCLIKWSVMKDLEHHPGQQISTWTKHGSRSRLRFLSFSVCGTSILERNYGGRNSASLLRNHLYSMLKSQSTKFLDFWGFLDLSYVSFKAARLTLAHCCILQRIRASICLKISLLHQ